METTPATINEAAAVTREPGGSGQTDVVFDQGVDATAPSTVHRRVVVASSMGFFADAYDLFVISTVAVLVRAQWGLSATQESWVTGAAILGAFAGALCFGRIADVVGRRRVYFLVALTLIVGAIASAVAPSFAWLVAARLLLGLGIGGDYPVSAVLMSEHSHRSQRGKLVGLVFSMQAVGLIVGPLVAISLLVSGIGHDLTWRLLLGLGAVPATVVVYLRTKIPESPRFQARVLGSPSSPRSSGSSRRRARPDLMGVRQFLTSRRTLPILLGTAGAWFLFDYAYYGNTLSLPAILHEVDPTASLVATLGLSLALFVVFAVPGYLLAIRLIDRFGHRRLQHLGFAVMAVAFLALGVVGPFTSIVALFIPIFGLSYFFIEFGPNTTTFVLPAEVFPTEVRTTGHGISAGLGKLGAFIGVFLVPVLQSSIGLKGMLLVAGCASIAGYVLTFLIPEPKGRSLEEISGEDDAKELLGPPSAEVVTIAVPRREEDEPLAAAGALN